MSKRSSATRVNEGILARNVRADVLAVGRGASATKHGSDGDLGKSLNDLREALAKLDLPNKEKLALDRDVRELERATTSDRNEATTVAGDRMRRICDRLKAAGVVVSSVATLIEPMQKIAKAFNIAWQSLGL